MALANMVYGVLHKTHPWAYSKSQMYHVSKLKSCRQRGVRVCFAARVHQ